MIDTQKLRSRQQWLALRAEEDFALHCEIADYIDAQRAELETLRGILTGVPQDAIDGGWTAAGISAYAKNLEAENGMLRETLTYDQQSLNMIATRGGSKADFMGTMRQVREYANSRARMARCALRQEGQGVNQSLTTERDGAAKGADHA